MNEKVRAFVAADLSDRVKSAVSEVAEQLRQARLPSVRPVNPEGIHLTVKFLGDVPTNSVPGVIDAVSGAARQIEPFHIELGAVGVFPDRGSPRTLWVGFTGDLDPLRQMHRLVDEAAAGLGFTKERRLFRPHLTLARVRDGASADARRSAIEAAERCWNARGLRFEVNAVSLIESFLSPKGARYEPLGNMPLGQGRRRSTG